MLDREEMPTRAAQTRKHRRKGLGRAQADPEAHRTAEGLKMRGRAAPPPSRHAVPFRAPLGGSPPSKRGGMTAATPPLLRDLPEEPRSPSQDHVPVKDHGPLDRFRLAQGPALLGAKHFVTPHPQASRLDRDLAP